MQRIPPPLVLLLLALTTAPTPARAQPELDTTHNLGLLSDVLADTVTARDGAFPLRARHIRLTQRPDDLPTGTGGENILMAAFDHDGDGRDEVLLGQCYTYLGRTLLLRGNDRGAYSTWETTGLPRYAYHAARGDLDNDGRCDLVMAGREESIRDDRPSTESSKRRSSIADSGRDRLGAHLSRGNGTFAAMPLLAPAKGSPEKGDWPADAVSFWFQPSLADVDRDGRLDLLVGEIVPVAADKDRTRQRFWYLRNLGDRLQVAQRLDIPGNSSAEHWYAGGFAAMSVHDVDSDGWPDLTILPRGGFFALQVPVLVYRNSEGRLASQPDTLDIAPEPRSSPPCWFDADADGDTDMLSMQVDAQGGRHSLHLGDGRGHWTSNGAQAGLWSAYSLMTAAAWGDLDQDGLPDLVPCLSASSVTAAPIPVLVNRGDGRFGNDLGAFSPPLTAALFAVLCLDVDGDLDLDVLGAPRAHYAESSPLVPQPAFLYRNESRSGHAVVLRLQGTKSNRSAIGARVELAAGARHQMRIVGDGGVAGTVEPPLALHFGLGEADRTGLVTVRWPSGLVETWNGLAAGRTWTLTEGEGSAAR